MLNSIVSVRGIAVTFGTCAALMLATSGANAAALLFNDFSDLTGLQLNGSTSGIHACTGGVGATCSAVNDTHGHKVLRLTNNLSQAGSAFSTTAISLDQNASFSTSFQFHFTDQQNTGADGIVFAVQTVSNTAGGSGGGIGYDGLTNSVGVEFDNWNNGGIDGNSANHVGINIGGSVNSVARENNPGFSLDSGDLITAWVDYDGVNDLLEVRANTTGIRPGVAMLSYTVDLVQELGATDAFVGFTSGTGSAGADHDILAWQFNSEFDPIDTIGVPEPGTLAVIGLGLVGLGIARRRARRS
jgi:hypothetical protein